MPIANAKTREGLAIEKMAPEVYAGLVEEMKNQRIEFSAPKLEMQADGERELWKADKIVELMGVVTGCRVPDSKTIILYEKAIEEQVRNENAEASEESVKKALAFNISLGLVSAVMAQKDIGHGLKREILMMIGGKERAYDKGLADWRKNFVSQHISSEILKGVGLAFFAASTGSDYPVPAYEDIYEVVKELGKKYDERKNLVQNMYKIDGSALMNIGDLIAFALYKKLGNKEIMRLISSEEALVAEVKALGREGVDTLLEEYKTLAENGKLALRKEIHF